MRSDRIAQTDVRDRRFPRLRRIALAASLAALLGPTAGADTGAVQPTDRPPAGTASLFDRLVGEAGGVPFPFERLVEAAAGYGSDAGRPSLLLVPDGRSLVRDQTSFEQPRVLLAAGAAPGAGAPGGTITRHRLFIGYAEAADELEVISWNEAAGRFEFQVVGNYRAGTTPVLRYAQRGFCFTCHQSEGPLFPRRPWGETNVHGAVSGAIVRARKAYPGEKYHGAPLQQPLREAEIFDALVADANVLVAAQQFWRAGCGGAAGGSEECRRRLLTQALRFRLDPAMFDSGDAEAREVATLQTSLQPAGGILVPDGRIPNRNPPIAAEHSWSVLGWFGIGSAAKAEIPADLDPKRPRPLGHTDDTGVYAVAASLGAADIAGLQTWASAPQQITTIVRREMPAALFADAPFQRRRIVASLAQRLGAPIVPVGDETSVTRQVPSAPRYDSTRHRICNRSRATAFPAIAATRSRAWISCVAIRPRRSGPTS